MTGVLGRCGENIPSISVIFTGGCSWPLKQQCGLYFSTLTPQTFPQSPIIVQQYSDSFLRENDEKTKKKLE